MFFEIEKPILFRQLPDMLDCERFVLNPLDHPICLKAPLRLAPSAWAEHVPFAMLLVDTLRPATIVELGTFSGVSYCAFCQAVAQLGLDCRCYAVDTWVGDEQSGFFGPEILEDLKQHHDPLYGGFSQLLQSTFDQALTHFPDGTIDLLHIDGYHTYESVKHDFDGWLRKMSNRGVILFHDTNERHDDFGVWKFWDQLKLRYPHFEFTHEHGLGVLAVGGSYPKKLSELFEAGPDERAVVRELFHRLGERLSIQLNGDHALKTLSWQVTDKEHIIDSLSAQLTDKEHIIDSLSAQLTGKEHIIDSLSAQLSEQERIIVERDKAVKWVQNELRVNAKQLSKKESVIVERDKAVKWLQDELRVNDQKHQLALAGLTTQSEQLVSTVQSISNLLTNERDRIATLEAQLAEKSDQLLAAERQMVEKEQELRSLRAMASDQGESIVSLSGRVVEQNQLLQELTAEDEESQQIIRRLAGQLAEKERQLAGKQRQLIEQEWQLTGKEQQLVSLRKEKEQIVATLLAKLAEKEQVLERTKGHWLRPRLG